MTNTIWERVNGQAEMRTNVRAALRMHEQTQGQVAAAAGVPINRLRGFLSGNTWLPPEDLSALAGALRVAPRVLIGGSIFKHETARYPEFHFRPVSGQEGRPPSSSRKVPRSGRRALCCQCGALRCTRSRNMQTLDCAPDSSGCRYTAVLACKQCGEDTVHAVLRDTGDNHRDIAEQYSAYELSAVKCTRDRDALIARLRGFGIHVEYRSLAAERAAGKGGQGYRETVIAYEYDESKSQWRIEIDPVAAAKLQVYGLQSAWKRISTDDFDRDRLDPANGVVSLINDHGWSLVVEDLLEDIRNSLPLERRRLAAKLRDEVDPAGTLRETGGAR